MDPLMKNISFSEPHALKPFKMLLTVVKRPK